MKLATGVHYVGSFGLCPYCPSFRYPNSLGASSALATYIFECKDCEQRWEITYLAFIRNPSASRRLSALIVEERKEITIRGLELTPAIIALKNVVKL